jgi:hypothetical protein
MLGDDGQLLDGPALVALVITLGRNCFDRMTV